MDKNSEGPPAGKPQSQQVRRLLSIILSVYFFNLKDKGTRMHAFNLQQNMIEFGFWDIDGNPLPGNFIFFCSCNDLFCLQILNERRRLV